MEREVRGGMEREVRRGIEGGERGRKLKKGSEIGKL